MYSMHSNVYWIYLRPPLEYKNMSIPLGEGEGGLVNLHPAGHAVSMLTACISKFMVPSRTERSHWLTRV